MRKFLLSLTVLAGAAGAASGAQASLANPIPVFDPPGHMQAVQYHDDWRRREWLRRERHEEWRRHQEWRRSHQYRG